MISDMNIGVIVDQKFKQETKITLPINVKVLTLGHWPP